MLFWDCVYGLCGWGFVLVLCRFGVVVWYSMVFDLGFVGWRLRFVNFDDFGWVVGCYLVRLI